MMTAASPHEELAPDRGDPLEAPRWPQFDAFVGPHDHELPRTPPIYRAPGPASP